LDDTRHRLAILKRFAEVPHGRGGEKLDVLNVQRPIQSPALLGPGDFRGIGFFAEEEQGWIAGRGMNQQENQQTDEKENRDGSSDSMKEILCHLSDLLKG
jgi:hypothetical protein